MRNDYVEIPRKEKFDMKVIDSAFKKFAGSKAEDMEIYFVYAGSYWHRFEILRPISKSTQKIFLTFFSDRIDKITHTCQKSASAHTMRRRDGLSKF